MCRPPATPIRRQRRRRRRHGHPLWDFESSGCPSNTLEQASLLLEKKNSLVVYSLHLTCASSFVHAPTPSASCFIYNIIYNLVYVSCVIIYNLLKFTCVVYGGPKSRAVFCKVYWVRRRNIAISKVSNGINVTNVSREVYYIDYPFLCLRSALHHRVD